MLKNFIRTYSNPGDIILDNAFGSGSFLVLALIEGKNFIEIEKNENVSLFKKEKNDYIKIAKERLLGTWKNMEKETKQHIMNLSNYVYNIDGVSKNEYHRYYLTCFL